MKNILITATIVTVFISAATLTQGRSFIYTTCFQDPKKQDPSTTPSKPSKGKKGAKKKSNSIKSIAVGDSSTQYRKANPDGNKITKIDTNKQKESKFSPK